MNSIILISFFIIFITLLYIFLNNTIVNIGTKSNDDLLDNKYFNINSNDVNRWNYENKDFAPYIDGSYKQVTNNYIPNYTNSLNNFDISEDYTLNDSRVNIWKNQNNLLYSVNNM